MSISEITPEQARERQHAGARLIDVREAHERAGGRAEGAEGIAKAELESGTAALLPDMEAEILLICQSGARSRTAAIRLSEQGYRRVSSVVGGTSAWEKAGLPMTRPALDPADRDFFERYSRHFRLPGVGVEGQRRLQQASVLVVGAGGLGSPAALYLAASGIGRLRIVDDDRIDRSNLQRQVLHIDADVGRLKVESARTRLTALNPSLDIEARALRIDSSNVETLLEGIDVILDGSDNFPLRYLLNDACIKLRKPLVYGAIQRFQGQLSVFDAGRHRGRAPCYRCLFPQPPAPEFAPNCAEAGVFGVLPGIVGSMQAAESIKLILGIGEPLVGRLLQLDVLAMHFREVRLRPDPDCPVCAPDRAFPGYIDYVQFCAGAAV
ncbi:MAG: molybdopterin-synthase adenylyltransferase MoeB [Xanthomonadaceae bacterium]|jgi:molybdopterin/thiamine biosynthesis adenylyltransferase/rhodanese-related sulfurtransferase|nr:molybdopterin-synthase adenylyltransferase MoeB [Xanthomonadaceae bacterium]